MCLLCLFSLAWAFFILINLKNACQAKRQAKHTRQFLAFRNLKNCLVSPHLFYFHSIKKLSPLAPQKNKTNINRHHQTNSLKNESKTTAKQTEQPHQPPPNKPHKNKSLAAFKR